MKIRWTPRSVRVRLSPDEFQQFQQGVVLRTEVRFSSALAWCLRLEVGLSTGARVENQTLVLVLTRDDEARLKEDDAASVEVPGPDGGRPVFLIEVDQPCLH